MNQVVSTSIWFLFSTFIWPSSTSRPESATDTRINQVPFSLGNAKRL